MTRNFQTSKGSEVSKIDVQSFEGKVNPEMIRQVKTLLHLRTDMLTRATAERQKTETRNGIVNTLLSNFSAVAVPA